MCTVTLGDTGLTTSVLGYGCAGLMRPTAEVDRRALLLTAFDVGVRHFDVARYYGHGGAESVLGRFLAETGCRDQVTITTKFGLEPAALGRSSGGLSVMNLARRVAALHPGVRRLLVGVAQRGVRASRFDPASARRSLETSLRELGTDRVDLLLLHEATADDVATPGLREFLEEAKRAGKIRAFGLGTEFQNVSDIVARAPDFARIVQIENSLAHPNLSRLAPDPGRVTITHGSLKPLPALNIPDKAAVAGQLLGLALHENQGGVTLFSSIRPERIRENVARALEHAARMSAADWVAWRETAAANLATSATDVR